MAWYDRDYARTDNRGGPAYGGGAFYGGPLRKVSTNIVTTLIVVNVVVYILTTMTANPRDPMSSGLFRFMVLYTPSVWEGQIWRLITAQYLHWTTGHIFVNMLGLYFLGRPLAIDWGVRQFLAVYTVAGLLGNLFFVALTTAGWLPENPAAGASGCVLGLLGAAAVRYPHAQIWVYFLFPVKIRTAALVFAGLYVLNLISRGPNAGGDACHLAGLAFGALWAFRGEHWWRHVHFRIPSPPGSRKPERATPASFKERIKQRREDEELIDRILQKVYDGGVHSLTDSEKRALHEATERRRAADADAPRVDQL